MTQHRPHLLHGEALSDALPRAYGEWNERVRVVNDFLVRFLKTLGDEPAIGPEGVRVGEIARITMHGVGMDSGLAAIRHVAEKRSSVGLVVRQEMERD